MRSGLRDRVGASLAACLAALAVGGCGSEERATRLAQDLAAAPGFVDTGPGQRLE